MRRTLSIIAIVLILTAFNTGCIKSFEESESASPRPASCDECHTFPGSDYCRNDIITADGITGSTQDGNSATSCVLCHRGAIKLDSSVTTDTTSDTIPVTITVYHDLMLNSKGDLHIAMDSLHTDGKVDVNFGQCTKCHGYPPNKDGHNYHVQLKKGCYDCHLFSIQCSTQVIGENKVYYPIKPKMLGGDSLPLPDPGKHLNGISGDVAFKAKIQNLTEPGYDTLYLWDPTQRSCSNIQCHRPVPDIQHVIKEIWKEAQ